MITRTHGMVQFECDSCADVLDTDEDDFQYALAQFKRDGWQSRRVGSEWSHYCPSCIPRRQTRTRFGSTGW